MIKTIKGAEEKLKILKEKNYKYCLIEVDGNTIGPAIIDDILGSLRYCRSPRGIIKQFIFHGYEYVVDEGVTISPLTKDAFIEHYMPRPKNTWTGEHNSHDICKPSKEVSREEMDMRGSRPNTRQGIAREEEIAKRVVRVEKAIHESGEKIVMENELHREEQKSKDGFVSRFRKWLRGDVSYKR